MSVGHDRSEASAPASELVELLRRLSHDLREPMTAVLGSTELLLESNLDTAQRLAAENAHRSGRELLDVLDQVLAQHEIVKSAPPSSGEYKAVPGVAALLSGRRVLLVEDNAFNRALIERVLEPMGCSVERAASGLEALRLFRPGVYDLVLMDCQMPGLDGLSTARKLRELEPADERVPIVAVTAAAISGARRACLEAGMDDFLPKPFSLARLRKKVLEWMLPKVESDPPARGEEAESEVAVPIALASEQSVNLARLDEVAREAGSPEIVHELSGIFLEDLGRRLVALSLAAQARDQRAYLNVIHAIKGASGNFGAVRMARLAETSEKCVKQGDFTGADRCVEELRREFDAVRSVLERDVLGAVRAQSA
jgi:hypothetical protein